MFKKKWRVRVVSYKNPKIWGYKKDGIESEEIESKEFRFWFFARLHFMGWGMMPPSRITVDMPYLERI